MAKFGRRDGKTTTDTHNAVGSPIQVSEQSYDPGYSLEDSWGDDEGGAELSRAELKRGFTSYGKRKIGE